MSTSTCSDYPLMMKFSKGLWAGVITAGFGEPPESTNPTLQKYKKDAFEKFAAKGERWGTFYYAGMLFAEPFVEGLRRAGRDLTREKLVASMETIKDLQGIGGKISYGVFDPKFAFDTRQGTKQVFQAKCGPKAETIILKDWFSVAYP